MTASKAEILEAARQQAGLSNQDLWIGYYAIGGRASPATLDAYLTGAETPDAADYDIVAQALNDSFIGQDSNHPVPYADELDL